MRWWLGVFLGLCVVYGLLAVTVTSAQRGNPPPPAGAPTATPTCTHPTQRTATAVPAGTNTPTITPTAYAFCTYYGDPYGDPRFEGGNFNQFTVPKWRIDCNNDNNLSSADDLICLAVGGTVPPGPTATATLATGCYAVSDGDVVGTCTPCPGGCGGGETPTVTPTPTNTGTPTITPTPTEVRVTEEQATQLISQSSDMIVLLFITATVLPAVLVGLVLMMWRRR